MDKKQIENEIVGLKDELKRISSASHAEPPASADAAELVRYLIEERVRTNRILEGITKRIKALEESISAMELGAQDEYVSGSKELVLSDVDVRLVNFVQTRGMACAEEVRKFMGYRGNNAACARLNRLHKAGLLERLQVGHKVYYRYDAGKATSTLIVSPPQ
jgi:hypothetical protein